jgi:hypothetical protein
LLALRLRELAAGYRGIGSTGMGGMPLSGLGGLTSGSGGLSGVTGLASGIPASLMGSLRSGGGEPGGESGAWISGYPWIWCTPAVSVPADWLHVCAAQGWFGYTAERIWAMHRLSKSRVGRRTPNSRWVYTGVEVA